MKPDPALYARLNERADKIVMRDALREALALGHNYIGPEHLLLASARNVLHPREQDFVRYLVLRSLYPEKPKVWSK